MFAGAFRALRFSSKSIFAVGLSAGAVGAAGYAVALAEEDKVALNPSEWRTFTLRESRQISHNTKLLRFDLPSKDHRMGLTVASCLTVRAVVDGQEVVRPYTPISTEAERGYVDLLIKEYPAPDGVMSRHINSLKPGDKLEFKGPWAKLEVRPNQYRKIGMIAGGTGITPMLQVARAVVNNIADLTDISLVFGNVTKDDILLRDELDALAFLHPNFRVHYTLDKPPQGWKQGHGHVTKDMIKATMPAPNEEGSVVLVCGPTPMVNALAGPKDKFKQGPLGGVLKELGYTESQVYKF